jgi:iron complex outermembrane receptor protein
MDRYSLGSLYSASTAGAGNRTTFTGSYWQTSHEARLAFKKGPIFIQAGGYYFKEQSGIAFFILDFFGPNSRFGFRRIRPRPSPRAPLPRGRIISPII